MSAAPKIRIFEADVQPVRISELRIDEKALQSRAGTDPEMVQIYAERRRGKPNRPGTPFPPVLVFIIDGIWWLADGFHRVAAALKLGEETIPAIVRRANSMVEAIDAGAVINMSKENLRGYQEKDRKRLAELYIRCGAGEPDKGSWDWSNAEIARRCGVSQGLVEGARFTLLRIDGVPLPDEVVAFRDGTKFRRQPYRKQLKRSSMQRDGRRQASIGGKQIHASGEDAESLLEARRREVESIKIVLANGGNFRQWLQCRSVQAVGVNKAEFVLGGVRIGVAYVAPFSEAKSEPILARISKCVLAMNHLEWAERAIVVGYRDGGGEATASFGLAAALNPPVEHMTPEEFVERALAGEFGETLADAATDKDDRDDAP